MLSGKEHFQNHFFSGSKTVVFYSSLFNDIQYIPRNMHTVFALLCFVVVIHWLIFPYPSGLLHWLCGNLTIAPVPAKQPWWIWINTSCEFIMNVYITTTKQSTTKSCAYFLGYTVPMAYVSVCSGNDLGMAITSTSTSTSIMSKWMCDIMISSKIWMYIYIYDIYHDSYAFYQEIRLMLFIEHRTILEYKLLHKTNTMAIVLL